MNVSFTEDDIKHAMKLSNCRLASAVSLLIVMVVLLVHSTWLYERLLHRGSFSKYPYFWSVGLSQVNNSCHKELGSVEQWGQPLLPTFLQNVSQRSQQLVDQICKEWLLPPFTGQTRLKNPDRTHFSQRGQSEFIDRLLKQRKNGFYVECGAGDGEYLSNSLFFERSRNWTGLLVEANPANFRSILEKRRHAYMVNACLSPSRKPVVMPFRLAAEIGGLVGYMERSHEERIRRDFRNSSTIAVQCLPLYSVLRAIGVSHVDYFSLDIEGAELEVLYTIPLDLISIDVLSIEFVVSANRRATIEKLAAIYRYLVIKHGYTIVRIGSGEDVILMK